MVERFLRRYLKIDDKNLLDEVIRISTVEYFLKNEKLTRDGRDIQRISDRSGR